MDLNELRDFEELFATNAWRRICKDAEEALRERERLALQAHNFEEVCYYKGEAAQLSILLSLETAVRLQAAANIEE